MQYNEINIVNIMESNEWNVIYAMQLIQLNECTSILRIQMREWFHGFRKSSPGQSIFLSIEFTFSRKKDIMFELSKKLTHSTLSLNTNLQDSLFMVIFRAWPHWKCSFPCLSTHPAPWSRIMRRRKTAAWGVVWLPWLWLCLSLWFLLFFLCSTWSSLVRNRHLFNTSH